MSGQTARSAPALRRTFDAGIATFVALLAAVSALLCYLVEEWRTPAAMAALAGLVLAIAGMVLLLLHARRAGRTAGLQEGEQRMRSVFGALSDGVIVLAADGTVSDLNPAAERILGIPRISALGRRSSPALWRCYRQDGTAIRPDEHPYAATPAASGLQLNRVVQLRRRDGTASWLSLNTGPLDAEAGGQSGAVISLSDVTARMSAEAALRASEEQLAQAQQLEAIGRVACGLACDYDSMLGIVVGNLDRLAPGMDGENGELMETVAAAAQRGAEVTRSLLGVAQRQRLAPAETDVNELLLELAPLLRQTAGRRVEVTVDARAHEAVVHLDPGGFDSAILNLVINARDAMPAGGRLRIATGAALLDESAVPGLEPGRYTRVTVADTGDSMSPEAAARAFDPFYTIGGRGPGAGLGLAMVRSFARRFGGAATLSSTPGQGTTITLLFPCAARAIPGDPAIASGATPAFPIGEEHLLLVDDETDLLLVNRVDLQALGYDRPAGSRPARPSST